MEIRSQPVKILVIDDSVDVQGLVQATFQDKRWQVYSASDGEEGLEAAQREKPDVALLDIVMPKLQGWSVCEALKRGRVTENIKVVMLSALIQGSHKRMAFQAGADAYIEKPFSPYHLIETVNKVLQQP